MIRRNAHSIPTVKSMDDKPTERKFHILHLEDDANDAEFFRRLLAEADILCHITLVQTQQSYLKALDLMQFDLIVSDSSLPMLDGRSALEIARQKCPGTPFIFVSGTIGHDEARENLALGAAAYIPKKNMAQLIPAVRIALRQAGDPPPEMQ